MPENIEIRIDNPCAQRWDEMHPEGQGRFCDACRKTIVDFTMMNDQEVLSWLSRRDRSICGRFHPDQLNRNLLSAPKRTGQWAVFWQLLLAGFLVSAETAAQTTPSRPTTVKILGEASAQPIHAAPPDTLKGRVIDPSTGAPFEGATVQFGKRAVATDQDGRFCIPRKAALAAGIIKISYIGYEPFMINVDTAWLDNREMAIALSQRAALMGDVVTVKVARKRKPLPPLIKDTLASVGLAKKNMVVYPNPVARGATVTLSVRLDKPGTWSVQLFNAAGMAVENLQVEGSEGSKDLPLPIPSTLNPGTYFIRLSHPSLKKVYTREVLVL